MIVKQSKQTIKKRLNNIIEYCEEELNKELQIPVKKRVKKEIVLKPIEKKKVNLKICFD